MEQIVAAENKYSAAAAATITAAYSPNFAGLCYRWNNDTVNTNITIDHQRG
jgi:hypothetical protein